MGFQGDVAGLGLGELLQGLARGGREGVLTLRGGKRTACIGVLNGQIVLLPEEDEDPDIWRKRCERAWASDPDQRIDILRMSEIAHASRMEGMFELLDCEGVHFRFEAGALPDPKAPAKPVKRRQDSESARMETGGPIDLAQPVHCAGMSVEFLLLEYARLADENESHPDARSLSEHALPFALVDQSPGKGYEKIWDACDGHSNVGEVADRLGWPIRQARATIHDLIERGYVRLADGRELLGHALNELAKNHLARAASRLAGWCQTSEPGRPSAEEAEAVMAEWERGKLPVVLASMPADVARTFLRKLDLAANNVVSSIARWTEMRKYHRHDPISELRLMHWQCKSESEADAPAMSELMRVARRFQENNQRMRAGAMLRAAAERGPETTVARLELGHRMLAVGLIDEGVPWVLEVGRLLIDAGTPDKAVPPLRAALEFAPHHRELRALFSAARNKSSSGKRTRRNSLVVLSIVLVLVLAAVVKLRFDQSYDRRVDEIADGGDPPQVALSRLELEFEGDDSPRVRALRDGLRERVRQTEREQRDEWMERYQNVQQECSFGDINRGLRSALELTKPPDVPPQSAAGWPALRPLLEGLAARLEQTVAEWGEPSQQLEAAFAELRLKRVISDALALVAERDDTDSVEFRARLESLRATLTSRDETRAKKREEEARTEQAEKQDILLTAARAHAQAGDLERSVQSYHKLAEVPGSERVVELLAKEIAKVEAHYRAVLDARELAARGEHERALEVLRAQCDNPSEHLLPCTLDSLPRGARVELPDGSQRTTPFVLDVAPDERLALQFELAGFETEHTVIEGPADRRVPLSRVPERWWRTSASVEALPVSVESDHIVCDRAGHLARLQRNTSLAWTRDLQSLGGIARTPVFLPERAGSLLLVTEEGVAWIVNAGDGHLEGPWSAGSPPLAGPVPTQKGARVSFANATQGAWLERLRPEVTELEGDARTLRDNGHDAGLAVLRRTENLARTLESPWGNGSIEIAQTHFFVRSRNATEATFAARREGEWIFVAWEAPHARLPRGRVWVSDGAGVRGFEP